MARCASELRVCSVELLPLLSRVYSPQKSAKVSEKYDQKNLRLFLREPTPRLRRRDVQQVDQLSGKMGRV